MQSIIAENMYSYQQKQELTKSTLSDILIPTIELPRQTSNGDKIAAQPFLILAVYNSRLLHILQVWHQRHDSLLQCCFTATVSQGKC